MEISQLEERIEQLHADLATPEVLRDGRRVKQVQSELEEVKQRLQGLYQHWEEQLDERA